MCATSALKAAVKHGQAGRGGREHLLPARPHQHLRQHLHRVRLPGRFVRHRPSRHPDREGRHQEPGEAGDTVTLAPGQVAHATLQVAQAGNYDPAQCKPVTAHWLRIFPPDQTAPLYVSFTTKACSARLPHSVGSQLAVSVFQPGAS
jgi:hypothetical protein